MATATKGKVFRKKTAPKRKTVKEVKPITNFSGYSVRTDENDKNYITFGCGAVRIARKTLLALAPYMENSEFVKALGSINEFSSTYYETMDINDVMNIPVVHFERVIAFKKNKSFKRGFWLLEELKENARSHYGWEKLIGITPEELRGLAAVPKDLTC